MLKWYEKTGKNDDVVLETRIRLARNFANYKFAGKMDAEEASRLVNGVIGQFASDAPEDYECIRMKNCDEAKRLAMKDRQQISSGLVKGKNGAVLLSPDESTSIMVNAEDHVRIQVLANGMNMPVCFKKANDIDDYIDSHFEYAFDEKFGYKTTYPTNVGTGLRASYTLHLPALSDAKRIQGITTELARFGIKCKNVYGDDENNVGHLYQIASQRTLGQNEREIIKDLDDIVNQLIVQEREQRQAFYERDSLQMEDEIYKSYGVLRYARKISLKDAMVLLSELMLGRALGVIKFEDERKLSMNRCLMEIQPAALRGNSRKDLSVAECDIARAEYLRAAIPEIGG